MPTGRVSHAGPLPPSRNDDLPSGVLDRGDSFGLHLPLRTAYAIKPCHVPSPDARSAQDWRGRRKPCPAVVSATRPSAAASLSDASDLARHRLCEPRSRTVDRLLRASPRRDQLLQAGAQSWALTTKPALIAGVLSFGKRVRRERFFGLTLRPNPSPHLDRGRLGSAAPPSPNFRHVRSRHGRVKAGVGERAFRAPQSNTDSPFNVMPARPEAHASKSAKLPSQHLHPPTPWSGKPNDLEGRADRRLI
jgi:hypothetical protein